MELARAGAANAFEIGHVDSQRDTTAGAVVLGRSDAQDSAFHLGFNQRQNVIVGFDFKTGGLLTSQFYFKRAGGFDRSEGRQVSLLGLADARAVHAQTSGEQEQR